MQPARTHQQKPELVVPGGWQEAKQGRHQGCRNGEEEKAATKNICHARSETEELWTKTYAPQQNRSRRGIDGEDAVR